MKRHIRWLFPLAALALLALSCCTPMEEADSTQPWVEPKDWEGRMPGFPDQPH